jgi:hypothetical protein
LKQNIKTISAPSVGEEKNSTPGIGKSKQKIAKPITWKLA